MRALGIVAGLLVLAALGAAGGYAWLEYAATTPVAPAGENAPKEFRVNKGATLAQVGRELEAAKLIPSAFVWRLYVRVHGGPSPKAGRHPITPGMNVPELLKALAENPLSDDVPLTMVEGWRLVDADAALTALKLISSGAYLAATADPSQYRIPFPFSGRNLEGYLFPETYAVPPGPLDVKKLVERQVEAFHQRFYLPYQKEIEASGRTLEQLVVVASLLEREEPDPARRPEVAGVIYKRLDMNTPLGIDATSRYMLANWNDRKSFLKALNDPAEPYNTRKRAGLPPGPIGAPSLPSLLAALKPVTSPYLYYLHDAQRNIHFSRTAEEHEAKRKRYNVY